MPDYTLKTKIGDGEVPVAIEFEYFPGTPAKDSGDPDKCYPAEGPTYRLVSVVSEGFDYIDLLSDSWINKIDELCINHVASIGEA